MDKQLSPVRYEDVSALVSRREFRQNYTKVVSDIYLHNDLAQDLNKVGEALLMRCPEGVLRGFSALANRGYDIGQEQWTPAISISRDLPKVREPAIGRILRRKEPPYSVINAKKTVPDGQAVADILRMPTIWEQRRDGTRLEEKVALVDHLGRQNTQLFDELKGYKESAELLKFVNPLAESRPESITRVRLHKAGLKGFRPQIFVQGRDGYYFIDIGETFLRIAVDYQGAHHFKYGNRAKDAQRMNELRWAGWTVFEVTWEMLIDEGKWKQLESKILRARDDAMDRWWSRLPPPRYLNGADGGLSSQTGVGSEMQVRGR